MVMIEYQLVPLFQSIGAQTQLTNSSSIDFQIQLSDPFPGFSANNIELTGDLGTCQPGTLSGSGTSLVYTVTDCVDGEVGISIPANSIAEQSYSGPEITQSSAMVTVDRTAPAVLEITQEDSELIIPITEPVLQPQADNYSFTSSTSACQVDSFAASSDQLWIATLSGCEGSSFSFKIVANSVVDLAGNTGPNADTSFAVTVPEPAGSAVTPVISSVAKPPNVLGVPARERSPLVSLETLPTQDSEVTQAPTQRRQAAQSVITASTAADPVNSSLGWTVGLAIAGVLLLAAGLSLKRRGISDLLIG
jgi:hypothetical protein